MTLQLKHDLSAALNHVLLNALLSDLWVFGTPIGQKPKQVLGELEVTSLDTCLQLFAGSLDELFRFKYVKVLQVNQDPQTLQFEKVEFRAVTDERQLKVSQG